MTGPATAWPHEAVQGATGSSHVQSAGALVNIAAPDTAWEYIAYENMFGPDNEAKSGSASRDHVNVHNRLINMYHRDIELAELTFVRGCAEGREGVQRDHER